MRKICCLLLAISLLLAGCSLNDIIFGSETAPQGEGQEVEEMPLSDDFDSGPECLDGNCEEETPSAPEVTILRLTVPEGYTLARIGMRLEEMGVCTVAEFIEAAETGDYSGYKLFNLEKPDTNRCYELEGYLFPDTYEIYSNESPGAIIRRMLDRFEQVITAEMLQQAEEKGYTLDEILAIASIIEKEAFGPEHMPMISSVIYNRLEIGMRLQCDVTIIYVEGAIKPFITGDKNRYNEDYNTFKCAAIPAGAICNPSIAAIESALNPAESEMFFFVTDADKNYYFSETYEKHLMRIADIDKAKRAAEASSGVAS